VDTEAAVRRWIRFRPDGLVAEQHDYWNAQEGRIEPPEDWGR
jgi:hypothetical protein